MAKYTFSEAIEQIRACLDNMSFPIVAGSSPREALETATQCAHDLSELTNKLWCLNTEAPSISEAAYSVMVSEHMFDGRWSIRFREHSCGVVFDNLDEQDDLYKLWKSLPGMTGHHDYLHGLENIEISYDDGNWHLSFDDPEEAKKFIKANPGAKTQFAVMDAVSELRAKADTIQAMMDEFNKGV